MMDKKVMYALIGGVALIGAAIAYSMGKGDSEIDEVLNELGPVERD